MAICKTKPVFLLRMSCPYQAQKYLKHFSSPVNSDRSRNLKALKGDLSEVWFKSLQVFLAEQLLPCEEWSHYWTCSTCSLQRRQSETTCSVWSLEGALAWCSCRTWSSRRRKQRGKVGNGGKGVGKKHRQSARQCERSQRWKWEEWSGKVKKKKWKKHTKKKGCKLSASLGTTQLWWGHSKDHILGSAT